MGKYSVPNYFPHWEYICVAEEMWSENSSQCGVNAEFKPFQCGVFRKMINDKMVGLIARYYGDSKV